MATGANAARDPAADYQTASIGTPVSQQVCTAMALAIGVVFGITGNFVSGTTQNIVWMISSIGIVAGGFLLAVRYARLNNDMMAVGFAIWAMGEAIIMSGGRPSEAPGYATAAFAGGVSLYVIGLLLTGVPSAFPIWARIPGILAAIPFGMHVVWWQLGHNVDSTGPLAGIGYGLMALTMVTWIVIVLRDEQRMKA